DPGEIERGGPGAADPGADRHELAHAAQVLVHVPELLEWKAGAEQRILELVGAAHADAPVVEESARAPRGREELVAVRIVDHGLARLAFVEQADRDAVLWKAMQEIRGAVQGIDDPHV